MDKQLLSILVCPESGCPLRVSHNGQELISSASKLAYPIKDGIPILLKSQARVLTEDEIKPHSRTQS